MNDIKNRNLDGYYFRVKCNNKWQSICWSDLTEDEMKEVLNGRTTEWLQSLCIGLGKTIKKIGDDLDICIADEE